MDEAKGRFDVRITQDATVGVAIGRFSVVKTFEGDFRGTGVGEMLAVRTGVPGSAGYVLIEQVTGTLDGRSGSFMLQHGGLMDRGRPDLRVVVIPDSGTDDLAGLEGEMTIDAANDHAYVLRYAFRRET